MNFTAGIILTILVAMLILMFLVLMNGADKRVDKAYTLIIICLIGWIVPNYLLDFMGLYQNSFWLLWLSRLALLTPIFAFWALVYFSFLFPKPSQNFSEKIVKMFVMPAVIMVPFVFTALNVSEVIASADRNSVMVKTGPLYIIFIIYAVVCLGLSIYLLLSKKNDLEEIYRRQINSVLTGIVMTVIFAVLLNIVLLYLGVNVAYAGPLSLVFLVSFSGYAIVKHRLFNIKVILTETVTVLISLAVLVQTLLSKGFWDGFTNVIILSSVVCGGYLIIKSVQNEIRQKEELQILSKQLEQANVHLKQLDEMKTEFVSLASHELLTPVSAIEGYLSMLLDEKMARVDDPKAKKYLDNVYSSAKRLARLIADMLNISRIEEGRLSVEKSEVNVGEMINQVIAEIRFKAEERKQTIIFDNGKFEALNSKSETISNNENSKGIKSDFMTFGDPDKIKEILINIIGNSIKYSRDPGVINISVQKVPRQMVDSTWARVESEIKARPLDDQEAIKSAVDPHYCELVGEEQLMISVKDQGVGIPREELPRLFKKFHRVGNYSTQESQGTGLGLYISRALVELQHGRIWADSEGEGKGSTFTFTLPELAVKDQILALEQQIPMDKEQMKPLARPMKSAAEEL